MRPRHTCKGAAGKARASNRRTTARRGGGGGGEQQSGASSRVAWKPKCETIVLSLSPTQLQQIRWQLLNFRPRAPHNYHCEYVLYKCVVLEEEKRHSKGRELVAGGEMEENPLYVRSLLWCICIKRWAYGEREWEAG
jgi:hypothetical protein